MGKHDEIDKQIEKKWTSKRALEGHPNLPHTGYMNATTFQGSEIEGYWKHAAKPKLVVYGRIKKKQGEWVIGLRKNGGVKAFRFSWRTGNPTIHECSADMVKSVRCGCLLTDFVGEVFDAVLNETCGVCGIAVYEPELSRFNEATRGTALKSAKKRSKR